MNKVELKKNILNKRRKLTNDDVLTLSKIIFNKVIANKVVRNSNIILCYVSFDNEVDTYKLINYFLKSGKIVGVPKVIDNDIKFYYIDNLDNLKKGKYGIIEPISNNEVTKEDIKDATMIVPGTSFSKDCYRNGYGMGHYDRFIKSNNIKYLIGIGYDFQVFDNIFSESHDQKLNIVITDKNNYNT